MARVVLDIITVDETVAQTGIWTPGEIAGALKDIDPDDLQDVIKELQG